jgi:exosome complex component RRP40
MFPGDVIYARVCPPDTNSAATLAVQKVSYDTVELSCVSATTGKTDGLGPLKGGMLFTISVGFAAKLVRGKREGVFLLDLMGEKVEFECIVGRNGRVWVDSKDVKVVVLVGRGIMWLDKESDKRGEMPGEGTQRGVVERLIKELS